MELIRFNLLRVVFVFLYVKHVISLKSYPITTFMNAKWHQTPLYIEMSEYIADENSNLFWDFIDDITTLHTPLNEMENEQKSYSTSINISKMLLNSMQIPILKLVLAMHNLTPRVQLHFQLGREALQNKSCDSSTFVVLPSGISCDFNEEFFQSMITNEVENLDYFSFDHVYPGSESNPFPVILYADIGSSKFRQYHTILKEKAISGEIKYILRHYVKNLPDTKIRLSGYGVDMHLKSTEYKSQDDLTKPVEEDNVVEDIEMEVDGFDFKILKSRYPEFHNPLDRFRNDLIEKSVEIAPLKAWEFQDLSVQAIQRITSISGEESLQILEMIAQNFPIQAKPLLSQIVREDLLKEMRHNTEIFSKNLNLQPPDAALFMNGLYYDVETLDLAILLETLRTESAVLSGLFNNNVKGEIASQLLTLDLSTISSKEFAIDIRDMAIFWINDIESDVQYKRWSSSVIDLLRPSFGILRNIRRNLFNIVLVIDPLNEDTGMLLTFAENFVNNYMPIRWGLVFDTRKKTEETKANYEAIFCAYNYVSHKQTPRKALHFLIELITSASDPKEITINDIKSQFKKKFTKLLNSEIDDILGKDSDFSYGQQFAADFIEKLGFKTSPQILLNGIPLQQNISNPDDFEEAIYTHIVQQTSVLQKSVYRHELTDSDSAIDFLMGQPFIMPRLNQRILYGDQKKLLDTSGSAHDLSNVNQLLKLSNRDVIATIFKNIEYLINNKNTGEKLGDSKVFFTTLWIIGNLNVLSTRHTLENALNYMKSSKTVRVAFIPYVDLSLGNNKYDLNRLVWAATQTDPQNETTVDTIMKWLKMSEISENEVPDKVKDTFSIVDLHLKVLHQSLQRVFNIKESETIVMNSGQIYEPLSEGEIFTTDDFNLMEQYNNYLYADKFRKILLNNKTEGQNFTSNVIFKLITLILSRQQTKSRFTMPSELQEEHTVIKLPPKHDDLPFFDINAVLDPASKPAQKLASILILLRNVINCNMKVFLYAVEQHSDMPVKNFYRFVVEPEIQFTTDGKLLSGPIAKFTGLPANSLLTQNLQVPDHWLVEVVRSVYDLDNIKLIEIGGPVHSEYELEYLLLEGHCFDSMSGSPPRGLQITLGTQNKPVLVDTIVMANLGYFQLKANPGVWELRLRQGRSSDIYDITGVEGLNAELKENVVKVVISSFRSQVIKLRVSKKPDKINTDLLNDNEDENGIWNSITSSFTSVTALKEPDVLNIFSLASGHLYERLLRIMMLSVLKHTKTPVKFWFLKNYLSPQFIDFLPHMAKEYKFQYELVQYKWPRWLHQQTEKQRTIWGYKILFLDVLFPLDIKNIIFVDADAIVRDDLAELSKINLGDAPYAYTPFCDSRKEMDGFRFWKKGYWRNHLMGRSYHISALYLVDLKKFRKIAAGDRLRGQYQALSQDPNSLSNLDQDLPNNMIHQVPIKSLPEEWLWCETWCDNKSFKKAKVIDLCNNPMTKEAKLTAAQRIVPEWKDFDTEIKNLMAKVEEHEMDHQQQIISEKNKISHLEL